MRKTKKKLISYFLVLLMICVAFTFEPIPAKAANTVTTESGLRTAVANANDEDIINIQGDITLTSPLTIEKNVTLDFGSWEEGTNGSLKIDSSFTGEAALVIKGCEVTICGASGSVSNSTGNNIKSILVEEGEGANSVLNIKYIYSGNDTIATKDDSNTPTKAIINIFGGSYNKYPSTPWDLFDVSQGGEIILYGGTYEGFDPENTGSDNISLGDNTTVVELAYGKQVRSTIISDEFNKMLTDGQLVINTTITPTTYEEASALGSDATADYSTEDMDVYAYPIEDSEGKYSEFDIEYNNTKTGEIEIHRIKATYINPSFVDNEINDKASEYANLPGLDPNQPWIASKFVIKDLEVINMWANGFDPDSQMFLRSIVNYSGELKEYLGNSNFELRVVYVGAGGNTDLYVESKGNAVISYNDCVCAIPEGLVNGQAQHVIYVPDNTPSDKLIEVAQKRINDYLGDSTKVVLSYGGRFDSLVAPWGDPNDPNYDDDNELYRNDMLAELGITSTPDNYFIATTAKGQFKLLIVPDSTKMLTPQYKTVDIVSNVSISSDSPEVPLDTSIRASKLTSGNTYNSIVDKLGVEDNVTFDLKLYSGSSDSYVSSLSNDTFEVSIPIPDSLKGQDLMAYYVDADGKVTKYPANPVGDNAVFETNHFSIYTIAKAQPDVCTVNGASHKLTAVPAKAATTTAEGNKAYWTCDCGKWFADANGKTEITDKTSIIIPKLKDTTTESNTTTEAGNKETPSGTPDTGDSTNVVLLFGLLLVSAAVIFPKKKEK